MGSLNKSVVSSWSALSDDALTRELQKLNQEFAKRFHFSDIDYDTRRELCLFISERHETALPNVNSALLEMLRLLCRDRNSIDALVDEKVAVFIVSSSGLVRENPLTDWNVIEEAEKCLINSLFNSSKTRSVFHDNATEGLLKRLRSQLTGDFSDESVAFLKSLSETDRIDLWYFDLRISFIATAHSRDLQTRWREDFDSFSVFTDTVQNALDIEMPIIDAEQAPPTPHFDRAGEALKIIFNILCNANFKISEVITRKVTVLCYDILKRGKELGPEMVQHCVNLLATTPVIVDIVCPEIDSSFNGVQFEGRDMSIPNALVNSLESKLDVTADTSDRDLLVTLFPALLAICTDCKEARRYCRMRIIPPLTADEVSRRPDEGDTLRNRIVRAMQAATYRDLAAEFLFVLCKRSVPRLIKYTGFGHAAGVLANRGLLGSINAKRESDSEDSETEEYKDVQDSINPVTGYIDRRSEVSPLEGMSDEQKEYEAMKLVQAIDQMMRSGAIKPATIGDDGKPREVEHVLELLKNSNASNDQNSDSDDD